MNKCHFIVKIKTFYLRIEGGPLKKFGATFLAHQKKGWRPLVYNFGTKRRIFISKLALEVYEHQLRTVHFLES